ncbi:hypothetical protein ACRIKX_001138 [Klebsiella pneumoniae]
MTKTIAQIRADYQYTDDKGILRDRTLNIPHYFKEIPFIYSQNVETGKVKFSARMQKLYCYVADWEKSGVVCYEEQSELARVCDLSRGKTNDLIELMESIGLLSVTKIQGRRNKELRALPLTDAHVIPPEALTAQPVAASDEEPAPTMTKVIEEAVIVAQSAPESVATTTESDQMVIDDDVIVEAVCERLSRPESLRQSQRFDTFTAYARRVLQNDGKRLPKRIEERLEERFEQLYPHLYVRFDDIGF